MSAGVTFVYGLCLAASLFCAILLVRGYLKHRTKLLLWSAACFLLLALNNFLMTLDVFVLPNVDLGWARNITFLAAIATLLYGFIWEID